MDRRDHSPSPPGRGHHHRGDAHHRDVDRRWGGNYDDGYRHHHYHSRARRDTGEEGDYQGMYDEGPSYQDDRSRRRDRDRDRYRDEDRYSRRDDNHHSRRNDHHARSRSPSLPREAGKPTNTVKIEGLPLGISSAHVRPHPPTALTDLMLTLPSSARA